MDMKIKERLECLGQNHLDFTDIELVSALGEKWQELSLPDSEFKKQNWVIFCETEKDYHQAAVKLKNMGVNFTGETQTVQTLFNAIELGYVFQFFYDDKQIPDLSQHNYFCLISDNPYVDNDYADFLKNAREIEIATITKCFDQNQESLLLAQQALSNIYTESKRVLELIDLGSFEEINEIVTGICKAALDNRDLNNRNLFIDGANLRK